MAPEGPFLIPHSLQELCPCKMLARRTWISIHRFPQAVSCLDHLPLLHAHVGQPGPLLPVLGCQVSSQQTKLQRPLYLSLFLIESCQCLERLRSSTILPDHLHAHPFSGLHISPGKPLVSFSHQSLQGRIQSLPPDTSSYVLTFAFPSSKDPLWGLQCLSR